MIAPRRCDLIYVTKFKVILVLGGKLPVLQNINLCCFWTVLREEREGQRHEAQMGASESECLIPYMPFVPLKIIFVPNIAVFSVGFLPLLVLKWGKTKTWSTSN